MMIQFNLTRPREIRPAVSRSILQATSHHRLPTKACIGRRT